MESCQILAVAGILVEPCYWRFKIAWTPFGVVLFGEEDFHPLVDHCPLLLLARSHSLREGRGDQRPGWVGFWWVVAVDARG